MYENIRVPPPSRPWSIPLHFCMLIVKIVLAMKQLYSNATTLVPDRIFGSNFACIIILILSIHPGMQNGGEGLPSISFASQGLLVKMLITLEPHGIV